MEEIPSRLASHTKPCLIIHGGAGNITPNNLPPKSWALYKANLLRVYYSTSQRLNKGESALDAATHAVTLFEDCELFNCGKGAVFTRDGTNELEASVMVTRGYHKRACGVVLLKHVKNPIKLAREMLVRGQTDGSGGDNGGGSGDPAGGSGGAQGHVCLGAETAEKLAKQWGLEMVDEKYYWTRKRWEEHRRGLSLLSKEEGERLPPNDSEKQDGSLWTEKDLYNGALDSNCCKEEFWDGQEYLPQGTVGAVALDRYGTICVATSTGGLTNKLPFRIGDTPTIGAGFWAEEWSEAPLEKPVPGSNAISTRISQVIEGISTIIAECVPFHPRARYSYLPTVQDINDKKISGHQHVRAVAVSGTGNGDAFLRLAAARTVGAIVRFSVNALPRRSLASAFNQIVGPGGEMQRSAEDRWGTGDGEGGMIGIELRDGTGHIVWDFNCGGLFRCWGDAEGVVWVGVFRDQEEKDEKR